MLRWPNGFRWLTAALVVATPLHAQRAPAAKLTETARAEVDYLLRRLAKHDKRASGLGD